MITQFFMPMNPPTATHQERRLGVRNGKPYTYEPPSVAEARVKLEAALAGHAPAKPYAQGVQLTVKWCFRADKAHPENSWRTTKPDTDNLQKLLKDCMTRVGFWTDDALVASEIVQKFYGRIPGLFIRVEPLEEAIA